MSELITVQKIENKTVQTGSHKGQEYRRVQIAGGRWCTVWDNGLQLSVGAAYRADLKSEVWDGETRWQIDGAVIATPSQATNGAAPMPPTEGGRERRIQAECALRAAVDASRVWPQMIDAATANALILATADTFLGWLLANDGTRATDEPF